jgi:tetratricopeptide (TPR) repeat protein
MVRKKIIISAFFSLIFISFTGCASHVIKMPKKLPDIVSLYKTVTVKSGRVGMIDTGIQVKEGDYITIIAKGEIDFSGKSNLLKRGNHVYGPAGLLLYRVGKENYASKYHAYLTQFVTDKGNIYLGYGYIGSRVDTYGEPLNPNLYSDDTGYFSVDIIVWKKNDPILIVSFWEELIRNDPQNTDLKKLVEFFRNQNQKEIILAEKILTREVEETKKVESTSEGKLTEEKDKVVSPVSPPSSSKTSSEEIDEAKRLNQQVEELFRQGRYREGLPLADKALGIREKGLGPEHGDVAISLNNLAGLYKALGDYVKAEPLYKRALNIREKVFGPDHQSVGTSLNDLALLYYTLDDNTKAEFLYNRALSIHEKRFGPNHSSVATTLRRLGLVYRKLEKYDKAESFLRRALAIREKAFGPEHFTVATTLNDLGALYVMTGNFNRAEPLFKRALHIHEKEFGPDHLYVATTLQNLASIYIVNWDHTKSESFFKRALAIREKTFGPEHPDVATILNDLGFLYYLLKDFNKAELLYKRSIMIYEKFFSPNHSSLATTLNMLALVYSAQGYYAKAEPLFLRALAIREKRFGPGSLKVSYTLNDLGSYYYLLGDYSKAESFLMRGLQLREKILGSSNPILTTALNNLGLLKMALKDNDKAESLFNRVLAIQENCLNSNHPYIENTANSLAILYLETGKFDGAFNIFKSRDHALGLGQYYLKKGNYGEAEKEFLRSLQEYEKVGAKESIVTSYIGLGYAVEGKKDYLKAMEYFRKSIGLIEDLCKNFEVPQRMSFLKGKTIAGFSRSDPYERLEYSQKMLASIRKEEEEREKATSLKKPVIVKKEIEEKKERIEKKEDFPQKPEVEQKAKQAFVPKESKPEVPITIMPLKPRDITPPTITLIFPEVGKEKKVFLKTSKITIRGKAIDEQGVTEVVVNGEIAELQENGNFTADVLLKIGENEVNITAIDIHKNQAQYSFRVVREGQKIAESKTPMFVGIKGKFYGLIVGIDDYKYLPKLQTAKKDAIEVDKLLRERYGFETKLLLDSTRMVILDTLNDFRKRIGNEDSLLIYYAGHGEYDNIADRAYWLPVDANRDNPTHWIMADDITTNIKRITSKHIMVVSDSCYLGTFIRRVVTDLSTMKTDRDDFIKRMFEKKSRTLMASGGNEPVLDIGGSGHSIFAEAFLKALTEVNEKIFTADELFYGFIREKVIGKSDQTPEYNNIRNSGHEGGDFVFIKK